MTTSAILLAGGTGSRMNNTVAKPYLELHNKPIILYSFEVFLHSQSIDEVIVVCNPEYQKLFANQTTKRIRFALPGQRRQDSVYNGLMETSVSTTFVCIHDGARPFITEDMIKNTIEGAKTVGASAVGMPIRFTIKEIDCDFHVTKTPDRSVVWEVQTPQVVNKDILLKGFAYASSHNITVTDDVSLAELIGNKVKLIEGSYDNIKITVPIDLTFAHQLISFHHA